MIAELKAFSALVVPPSEPRYASEDWQKVERGLGMELPSDYKQFIALYGSGSLQSFLHVVNFSDPRIPARQILDAIFSQLRSYQEAGKCDQFTAYPDKGGLFPFASTDDGNYLFWQTDGDANQWGVAGYDFTSGEILYVKQLGMVGCLLKLVQKANPFGDRFCNIENFDPPCVFKPWSGE